MIQMGFDPMQACRTWKITVFAVMGVGVGVSLGVVEAGIHKFAG